MPAYGGGGIVLLGAVRTVISDNEIDNNNLSQAAIGRGGVVIASAKQLIPGAGDPIDNTVRDNEIRNNTPADIVWDGSGTGNRFRDNDCGKSIPTGFCNNDGKETRSARLPGIGLAAASRLRRGVARMGSQARLVNQTTPSNIRAEHSVRLPCDARFWCWHSS